MTTKRCADNGNLRNGSHQVAVHDTIKSEAVKRRAAAGSKPDSFEKYLGKLGPEKRAALNRLRRVIHSAAPQCVECISYGLPAFRLNGRFFVALGGTSRSCSFYLGSTVQRHKAELGGYDTSRGTIRFNADEPLPTPLVRKLLRARISEDPRFKKQPQPRARTR